MAARATTRPHRRTTTSSAWSSWGSRRDLFANHDDELETLDADVKSSLTEAPWTTRHDEEVAVLGGNRAEVYFDLKLEDQACTSQSIQVRPPPP